MASAGRMQLTGLVAGGAAVAFIAIWLAGGMENDKISGLIRPAAALGGIDVETPVPGFSGRAAIAVLPFVNMSGSEEQQYFADGLTEDIITGIQAFRTFPVIARTSTFAYQGINKDVREIALELGVGYIVEGSVRRAGDKIRVTAQLINSSGVHLWAEKYDSDIQGLKSLEDEITVQIVNAIEPELTANEVKRVQFVRTEDLEAWDYYLKALSETNYLFGYTDLHGNSIPLERHLKARDMALKAIELDPEFARAYTLLAHVEAETAHLFRSEVTAEEADEAVRKSIEYGMLARRISPFDSTACSCLSFMLVISGEVERALDIQRAAIEANPSHSNAHAVYAWALLFDDQPEAALQAIEMAKRLSPRDLGMSTYLTIESSIRSSLGDLDQAALRAREAVSLSRLNYDARILHILALDGLGRNAEAREVLAAFLAETPGFTVDSLWTAPVGEALLLAAGIETDETEPSFHEFVADRLSQLGWAG